jgi:thiamine biosynthesis protein ThiC
MFYKLFQKLNYTKKFPFFICTPLVYGIGAASEHIAMASAQAQKTNKKLLIFKTHCFKKNL